MSTPFQNRLVGTVIVAAVIVIFLPDLLDGNKKSYQAQFDKIPARDQTFSPQSTRKFPNEKLQNRPEKALADDVAIDTSGYKASSPKINIKNNKTVTVAPVKKVAPIATTPKSLSQKKTPKKALPEKTIHQKAWVIHLGSFKYKNNVKELTEKLKAAGYTAFTKPIKTSNGVLTKVFVGPDLVKSKLDKQLVALKKLTSVQGKVARFYPTK